MIPPDMMMVGSSGLLYHPDSLIVNWDLMSDVCIRC